MKHIEVISNGKNKAILRTKDKNGYPYDLYYINSKEDLFQLRDKVNEFIEAEYGEEERQ